MKNLVKAIDQNTVGFMYLKKEFPRISNVKIKEGMFVGIQIRELIWDVKFENQLSEVWKDYGNHSKMSPPIFWGGIIMQKTIVIWWLMLYDPTKLWGCNMSLTAHCVDFHSQFFPENLSGQWEVNKESDFARIFPPSKGGTKASGVPVWCG